MFELAKNYGLALLESGRLVDTAGGEAVPVGARPMPVTSAAQVATLTRYTDAEAARLVARDRLGRDETPVIGPAGPLAWPHGFTLDRLDLAARETTTTAAPAGVVVVFVHRGALSVEGDSGDIRLVKVTR